MDYLLVIGGIGYGRPFKGMFSAIHSCDYYTSPHHCDWLLKNKPAMVLFTGGEDISPKLYNEPDIASHWCNVRRDDGEVLWFRWAVENKIPLFGTCRGMQLFTALSGGRLIQHVTNHFGEHEVFFKDGNKFKVNSVHHQMCVPDKNMELLAWAEKVANNKTGSKEALEGLPGDLEPESIYFPKINALGVQWHPEALRYEDPSNEYLRNLVKEKLYG